MWVLSRPPPAHLGSRLRGNDEERGRGNDEKGSAGMTKGWRGNDEKGSGLASLTVIPASEPESRGVGDVGSLAASLPPLGSRLRGNDEQGSAGMTNKGARE